MKLHPTNLSGQEPVPIWCTPKKWELVNLGPGNVAKGTKIIDLRKDYQSYKENQLEALLAA